MTKKIVVKKQNAQEISNRPISIPTQTRIIDSMLGDYRSFYSNLTTEQKISKIDPDQRLKRFLNNWK